MPLNEGAVNEYLPFAPEGLVESGDVLSLEAYKTHPMRMRGHSAGLALRELQNMANRQASRFVHGTAQFLANRYEPGIMDDGDADKLEAAWLHVINALIEAALPKTSSTQYELGEFYEFRHPSLRPGMQPTLGGVIQNAPELFPEGWEYLLSDHGQMLCVSAAEWQAMNTEIWHTNADGTQVGWGGIGGVPFYCVDEAAGTIRLPDIRGMYREAQGYDSLGVGDRHGDGIRNIKGLITNTDTDPMTSMGLCSNSGALYYGEPIMHRHGVVTSNDGGFSELGFDASLAVPTGNANKPRAWGALACVYLGAPK